MTAMFTELIPPPAPAWDDDTLEVLLEQITSPHAPCTRLGLWHALMQQEGVTPLLEEDQICIEGIAVFACDDQGTWWGHTDSSPWRLCCTIGDALALVRGRQHI